MTLCVAFVRDWRAIFVGSEAVAVFRSRVPASLIGIALSLAACGKRAENDGSVEKLDSKLLGKGDASDPALSAALEDQIMVDPSLASQSNARAVRPGDDPASSPVPPERDGGSSMAGRKTASLGEVIRNVAGSNAAKFKGCGLDVSYSVQWAARLPTDVPLPSEADVQEAGGSDQPNCQIRAVSFSVAMPMDKLDNWYAETARKAGYTAQRTPEGDGVEIGGTRRDGATFYAKLQPREGGGVVADFVSRSGR